MARSLCVVGHLMLPLLASTNDPVVGGAEVQSFHLAEELVRRGWRLEFLVCAMGGESRGRQETPLGTVRRLYKRRVRKSLGDKLDEKRSLFEAVRRTDADLVFERAVWDADVAALACRLRRRPFVYGLASDRDAVALPRWSRRRNVLRWSSAIVAQTVSQRDWVRRYGRDATCIASAFPLPEWSTAARDEVLWVGTLRALKRPEFFLDLAAAFPEQRFVLCGGPGEDAALAARVAERAEGLTNVRFEGFVPYRDIHRNFARARVLVNTSTYEGFPNTFVLAWMHGAAVLSLGVDPDGLLERSGLGIVTTDPAALRSELGRLLADDARRETLVTRARAHAERVHDVRRVANDYEALFESVLSPGR
jgi:glycosyltransferase involved in cell wall biosynthesis